MRQQDHVDAQAGREGAFGVDVLLGDEAGVLGLLLDVLVVPPGGLQESAADVRDLLARCSPWAAWGMGGFRRSTQ